MGKCFLKNDIFFAAHVGEKPLNSCVVRHLLALGPISKDAPRRELPYALKNALKHATGVDVEPFYCFGIGCDYDPSLTMIPPPLIMSHGRNQ